MDCRCNAGNADVFSREKCPRSSCNTVSSGIVTSDTQHTSPSAFSDGLKAALPIMAGYVVLGLPCGLLCQQAGLDWIMVLLMSALFYSGAGQYMIPNMVLATNPLASIILSVTLVNSRQMLYGASLSRFCESVGKPLSFLFGATVTDESFGVNLARFANGGWDVKRATFVNLCSQSAWIVSTVAGNLVGSLVSFPTAIASFAMTSIFICLLCMQKVNAVNVIAALAAIVGVIVCKCVGLSGPAILIGAVFGCVCGYLFGSAQLKRERGEHA